VGSAAADVAAMDGLGVVSAPRARASDQPPLVSVMTLLTVGGLGLLFGS
jgi:hypothetical protein